MKSESERCLTVWGRLEQGDDQTFILIDNTVLILDKPSV